MVSTFETKPQNLLDFWKNIHPAGGMGNQALEVAYSYLNENLDINQAIFIGDAAANTDEETKMNRKTGKGESDWDKKLPILSAAQ